MSLQLEVSHPTREEMIAQVVAEVRPYSMVPDHGIAQTVRLTLNAIDADIPGVLVECGTWKGGCSFAMLLAQRYAYGEIKRPIWMYDSFQGMGKSTELDGNHARGWLADCEKNPDDPGHFEKCTASLQSVTEAAELLGLTGHGTVVPGWFKDTIPFNKPEQIAVLRVDCDWYEPCKLVYQELVPLVSEGAPIIIDDYMVWEGCVLATHEYLSENKLPWRLRTISDLCGAWTIKEKSWW